MNIEALICSHIHHVELAEPPDWEALAAQAGVTPDQLLRLDTNENPYGPSPLVQKALAGFDEYEYYPDYRTLKAAIARYAAVEPHNIVLGNGGDEVIDLIVRLFVEPGEGVITCPPAFVSYSISATAHRGQVLEVPRHRDFLLDLDGIEALVTNHPDGIRPKLLFLTSPGNPDGLAITLEVIRRVLRLPLAVVVDEAYIEYGGQTAVPLLKAHRNLIVLRTFSKWAGMAGLRLGYAIAAPEVAAAAEHIRPIYNVNAAAAVAALATLGDMETMAANIERIISERARLETELTRLPGAHPLPSQASFILCRFEGRQGPELAAALARRGILVRSFSARELSDALRFTVGRPEQNDAVLVALRDTLSGIPRELSPINIRSPEAIRAPRPSDPGVMVPGSRQSRIHRQTRETDVEVSFDLDGAGGYKIETGLGFLDHMLSQLAAHGLFDLTVRARGDLEIDEHHTVEDVAIGLGRALDTALGDRHGIVRMGQAYAPLDEALAHVVVDLSGRPYAVIEVEFGAPQLGDVTADLIVHLLETLAFQARMALHARVLYGRNDHHKAEALFKALGRALDAATRLDPRRSDAPSTKGVL